MENIAEASVGLVLMPILSYKSGQVQQVVREMINFFSNLNDH